MKTVSKHGLVRIERNVWEIPHTFRDDMRAPARLYADETLVEEALGDRSLEELVHTAMLPGVVKYAIAMPDIHQGYGFPIGGVVATRLPDGVISPGGVGYDINCASWHRRPARKKCGGFWTNSHVPCTAIARAGSAQAENCGWTIAAWTMSSKTGQSGRWITDRGLPLERQPRKSMSVGPGRQKNAHKHTQENAEHYIQNDRFAFGSFAD